MSRGAELGTCGIFNFQRRPKGFSLTITIFHRMSHAFLSVSRKIIQSTCPIASPANCFFEVEENYTMYTDS